MPGNDLGRKSDLVSNCVIASECLCPPPDELEGQGLDFLEEVFRTNRTQAPNSNATRAQRQRFLHRKFLEAIGLALGRGRRPRSARLHDAR